MKRAPLTVAHGIGVYARRSDAFITLARSIIGLQISVQTAENVWQKLLESVGSLGPAASIARMDPSKLRACGLSSRKSA